MKIEVIKADIATLNVDAIVNAANRRLSPGGGVCGAIHDKAGPKLARKCAALTRWTGGVLPGDAVITEGYDLPARYVIHALGPVWRIEDAEDKARLEDELAECYRNSLLLAEEHQLESIAFPSIGTGAFGWDKKAAAQIAIPTVLSHKAKHVNRVILCCYRDAKEGQLLRSTLDAEKLVNRSAKRN